MKKFSEQILNVMVDINQKAIPIGIMKNDNGSIVTIYDDKTKSLMSSLSEKYLEAIKLEEKK